MQPGRVPTKHILFYKKTNVHVEKSIGPYVADVYMSHEKDTFGFVFEIVVTHEMEQGKKAWLHENGIPYLEVSPLSLDENTFVFNVIRINLPSYFASMEDTFINTSVVMYYEEIHDMIKKYISIEQSKKAEKSLKLKAWDWTAQQLLYSNLQKWIPDKTQELMKSLTVKPFNDPQSGSSNIVGAKYKRVGEHRMVFVLNDRGNETLVLNDKVVLSDLLNRLAAYYPTEAILGRGQNGREGVIGVRFQNLIDPLTYEEEWKRNMKQFFMSVRNRLEQQEDVDDEDI